MQIDGGDGAVRFRADNLISAEGMDLAGWDGDDVLEVAINLQNTSAPVPLLSGDGGQDDLTLMIYGSVPPLSGPAAASRDLATIRDFSPADDHLTIEVDAGLAIPTIRLELSAVGSNLPSYVVLDYPGGTVGRVVLTGINAGSGLTIADIELVRLVA